MERDDRKKLTANELYLQECMSILYTKARAITCNFYEKDGKIGRCNTFNIENLEHGTITCTYTNRALRISYDGTNFSPIFANNVDGGFSYKLKPLGIEYISSDKVLNNDVHERKVLRTVGKSADYYRYLSRDTFFILIEHVSKDQNGITVVKNKEVKNYSDNDLVDYFETQYEKACELEAKSFDDDEPMEEDFDEFDDADYQEESKSAPENPQKFSEKDIDEIEAFANDIDGKSIYEIDYSLYNNIDDGKTDEPYSCLYASRIEDFDYEKYMKTLSEEAVTTIKNEIQQNQSEENTHLEEDELDDVIEQDDEACGISDTVISEDGFIDDEIFIVVQNDNKVEGQKKMDITDRSVMSVMDIDREVLTLKDYYGDALTEVKKMRAIVIRRKERMEKANKNIKPDRKNIKKPEDKSIE